MFRIIRGDRGFDSDTLEQAREILVGVEHTPRHDIAELNLFDSRVVLIVVEQVQRDFVHVVIGQAHVDGKALA
jgi:hypothetical protein